MVQDRVKLAPLIEQALTCPGYANKQRQKGIDIKDNRPLATIGDKLLSFLFLEYIESRGFGTTMEQLTDFNVLIQHNGIQNEIGNSIFINDLEARSLNNDLDGEKGYATCLEAYIYALYKTKGMNAARKFLKNEVVPIMKSDPTRNFILELLSSKKDSDGKNWSKVRNDFIDFLNKI